MVAPVRTHGRSDWDSEIKQRKLTSLPPFFLGKTTFVKRHLTGEFEKKYIGMLERE